MKRSEINRIMREAVQFIESKQFLLPPFAYWTKKDWMDKDESYDEIRENMLGWDITDFGSGNYREIGLLMFTIRNGNLKNPNNKKNYAEKLLIVEEEQVTPFHFHWSKMEDIINRGGGNLLVQVYNSTEDEQLADTPVEISMDGRRFTVPAGEIIQVKPGESITLETGVYHKFWGEPGYGKVLVGEVSSVNDDHVDNRFLEPVGRFPEIEEDEEPLYLLYNDYFTLGGVSGDHN